MVLREKNTIIFLHSKILHRIFKEDLQVWSMIKYFYLYLFLKKLQLLPNVICQLLLLTE